MIKRIKQEALFDIVRLYHAVTQGLGFDKKFLFMAIFSAVDNPKELEQGKWFLLFWFGKAYMIKIWPRG